MLRFIVPHPDLLRYCFVLVQDGLKFIEQGAGVLQHRIYTNHTFLILLSSALIFLGIGFVVVQKTFFNDLPAQQSVLGAVIKRVDFPVYQPASLPPGYSVDARSVTYSQGILLYTLKSSSSSDNEISVTSQKLPASFNPSIMFSGRQVPSTLVKSGTLYKISPEDSQQTQYMLTTNDGTLVILGTYSKKAAAAIPQIVDSLSPTPKI